MFTDGNAPAYPAAADNSTYSGLTVREFFAAKVMQGLVVNSGRNSLSFESPEIAAEIAVQHADALIEALNK